MQTEITSLTASVKTWKDLSDSQTTDIESLNTEITTLKTSVQTLKDEAATNATEIDNLNSKIAADKITTDAEIAILTD